MGVFDSDGLVTTDSLNGDDRITALRPLTDGKIIVAGYSDGAGSYDFALARYTANGGLDGSFSDDGWVNTDFSGGDDYGYGIGLMQDGKLIIAGEVLMVPISILAWRVYTTAGSLDTSFGLSGLVYSNYCGSDDLASSMVVQPDGKIIVAGSVIGEGDV